MSVLAIGVDLGEVDDALTGEAVTGEDLLVAGILLVIGLVLAYLIGRWRRRLVERFDDQARQLVAFATRVAQVLVVAVAVGWALTTLGADIGWLTLLIVTAGLILVLAARPILEGMGASAALVARPAFSIGDEIEVDHHVGEVIEITNRSTVIRLRDGRRVHIPNVEMLTKTVIVYSVDDERRSAIDVTIGLGADIDHAEQVIRDALDGVDAIKRVGSIWARRIAEGVELSIRFWHESGIRDGNEAIDGAIRAIKAALEQEGIPMAPTVEVALIDSSSGADSDDAEH